MHRQLSGKAEFQFVQEDRLVFGRLTDAAFPNFNPVSGREDHIHQTELGQFIKHLAGFISQPRSYTELRQRLPQDVCQKANQKVSLDPFLLLMPDWTNLQVLFLYAESVLRFGQLDVGFPELLRRPIPDVAAEHVAPFTQRRPLHPSFFVHASRASPPSPSVTLTSNSPVARLF